MEPSEQSPSISNSWKSRVLSLVVLLVLAGLLFLGWSFHQEQRTSRETASGLPTVILNADLPRYETAQKPFTVRFSAKTTDGPEGDLNLFLLSDLPLGPPDPASGESVLQKGDKLDLAGQPLILPCNGFRVKARKEGDSWVAEPSLTLSEFGVQNLAYWFATSRFWETVPFTDGQVPTLSSAKRFLPALQGLSFHVDKVEVVSPEQISLLERVDQVLGQGSERKEDYSSSRFCRMGFGGETWQLVKRMDQDPDHRFSSIFLFGMEKGALQKILVCRDLKNPLLPMRVLYSPALGKDLLWVEGGKAPGEKARLFAWIDGKPKEVLDYRTPSIIPAHNAWTLENLFVTKDGILHVIHKGPDSDHGMSYLLETYDWDFEKRRYSIPGKVRKVSYAQYLIESGDYQDFLSNGFNRANFESLLDYFLDVNNEGSTRSGIHNLLVTASGTDFGEDRDAWQKWFEEKEIRSKSK